MTNMSIIKEVLFIFYAFIFFFFGGGDLVHFEENL